MKKIEVEWIDSCSPGDGFAHLTRRDADEITPLLMRNLGYLVSEDDECVRIAANVSETGVFRELICIPKVCIKKRRLVKGGF